MINSTMETRVVPIEQIKPAKYNPRKDLKPGEPEYEKIKRSLTDFGYVDPVIWNEVTGNIVGGHQRFKILKAEGAKEISCVVVHIENANDEKALNVALNKATGDWDIENLSELMKDLAFDNYDLTATAFDIDEIAQLVGYNEPEEKAEKEDDFDETVEDGDVETFTQQGDIWKLGEHRLICGDSTLPETFERLMNGEKAELVVTDPPYNVAYEGKAGFIQNDSMDDESFYNFLLAAYTRMHENMKDDASIYVFHADIQGLAFRKAFKDAGFYLSEVCIWAKQCMTLGRNPYQFKHEPVLFGWKKGGKHIWYADRKQTTIWEFDKPQKSKEHPTMKPIKLVCYPIKNSSARGGLVLDPFGGSGSTLIACEQINRKCYTVELDERFCDVIVNRFIKLVGNDNDVTLLRGDKEYSYKEALAMMEEAPAGDTDEDSNN